MTTLRRTAAWLACAGLAGLLLGCGDAGGPASPSGPAGAGPAPPDGQAPFDVDSGPHAAGKKVLVAAGCFRCHTVNGVRGPVQGGGMAGGPMPGRGPGGGPPMAGGPGGPGGGPARKAPDLGKVGADPEHSVDWFMKFIRNPKAVKTDARMPAFGENKVSDTDLRALAEYLANLK